MTPRRARRYWLMKSEPDAFSWQDLWDAPKRTTFWDGVRNYQARNLLRDDIQEGDGVLYYHSRTKVPGVVGIAQVVQAGSPDPTQFDPKEPYFDPKARREEPTWYGVHIQAQGPLDEVVSLEQLKAEPKLAQMAVVQRGQRLSVQPVTAAEWKQVLKMGQYAGAGR